MLYAVCFKLQRAEKGNRIMSAIVAALSFGAAAFAKGALSEAGKDAYKSLREAIVEIVAPSDVEKLEQKPDSESRKGVIAEELDEADKAEDPELAKLAEAMLAALKDAAESGGATGVSIEDVEATHVRLRGIEASGTGASIKKAKLAGDIDISDVSAGVTPGKR